MPRVGERYLYKELAVDIESVMGERITLEFYGVRKIVVWVWLRSQKMMTEIDIKDLEGQKLTDEIMISRGYAQNEEKTIFFRSEQLTFKKTPGGFYHSGLNSTFEFMHELQRFESLFINLKSQTNG